jgi:DNA-binding protein HU-beta
MNKGELTRSFSRRTGLSLRRSRRAIEALFGTEGKLMGLIPATLAQGKSVRLSGFGTFETRRRAARPGRNPRTGEPLMIQAARLPTFRAGRPLKDKIRAK